MAPRIEEADVILHPAWHMLPTATLSNIAEVRHAPPLDTTLPQPGS